MPALENQPLPSSHTSWIWEGFAALDGHRAWGQGFPQPIALSEILAYSKMIEMGRDQLDAFRMWVGYLDGVYLSRMADRNKLKK